MPYFLRSVSIHYCFSVDSVHLKLLQTIRPSIPCLIHNTLQLPIASTSFLLLTNPSGTTQMLVWMRGCGVDFELDKESDEGSRDEFGKTRVTFVSTRFIIAALTALNISKSLLTFVLQNWSASTLRGPLLIRAPGSKVEQAIQLRSVLLILRLATLISASNASPTSLKHFSFSVC